VSEAEFTESVTLKAARRQVHPPDQLLVAGDGKAVGHAGDEVADRAQLLPLVTAALPPLRQEAGIGAIGGGKARDDALGFDPHRLELLEVVEPLVQEALELALLDRERVRKTGERAS